MFEQYLEEESIKARDVTLNFTKHAYDRFDSRIKKALKFEAVKNILTHVKNKIVKQYDKLGEYGFHSKKKKLGGILIKKKNKVLIKTIFPLKDKHIFKQVNDVAYVNSIENNGDFLFNEDNNLIAIIGIDN